jgi:hypothetical protein
MDGNGPQSYDQLAVVAGLQPLGPRWIEVDSDTARAILASILQLDLAYDVEVMPAPEAQHLAREFVDSLGPTSRFAVNSVGWVERPTGWTPATDYTFDAGVAVLSEAGGAIYWVADED